MIGVSLAFIVAYALLASGAVIWLNARGTSAVIAGGVLLALCIVIGIIDFFPRGFAVPTRQAIDLWLTFVLLPSATVWGLSRAGFLSDRQWLLWPLGPMVFVAAVMVFGTAFNVVFGTRHQP